MSKLHWAKSRLALAISLSICVGSIVACSSVPDVEDLIDQPQTAGTQPDVRGANGPLTAKQSKAVLARLEREAPNTDVLQRHLALESALADSPLVIGNKVALLRDGPATFKAMFQSIRGAKDHINLEYFTFENVEEGGTQLGDLLVEKQKHGVQVNVIYDSFGSIDTPATFFDRLKDAGVKLLEFNPVNPIEARRGYSLNDRDHRKILIADGKTAVIGGVNLSKVYTSLPQSAAERAGETPPDTWRDTDIQIDGPAVAELQKLFLSHWAEQDGNPLPQRNYFPHVAAQGAEVVRVIGSTPDHVVPEYYVAVLSAIRNAEIRVWVSAAYFVPTHQELEDLIQAARRGVDVKLFLPSHSDSDLALRVGRSHYSDLLEVGVQIYETKNSILHSKTAVIDGVWSVVGSSNFDHRSVLFNDEVDAVILGRATAAQMEAMFEDDISKADRIDLKAWKTRPLPERIREFFSRIGQDLL